MSDKIEFAESSGNVFADLGLPNPGERLAKAELARQIRAIIEERELTQVQSGAILGIAQPNLSNLTRGRLSGFSIKRLMELLTLLGRDVRIVVTPIHGPKQYGEITVTVHAGTTGRERNAESV